MPTAISKPEVFAEARFRQATVLGSVIFTQSMGTCTCALDLESKLQQLI